MRVGIIGGGIAGLTAAYELTRRGCSVTLFEKEAVPGGQVRTFALGEQQLEGFYHHIFLSDTEIIDLLRELGLSHKLRWFPSRVGYFISGRMYDFVTPLDLLRFSPLPLWDRLRVGLVSLSLQRRRSWQDLEGITAREWLVKHAGAKACETIWEPLLRGKFGPYAGDIGMAWLWSKMRLRFGSRRGLGWGEKLGYLEGSFFQVIKALVTAISEGGGTIYLGNQVRRIKVEGGSVKELEVRGMSFLFDVVIAALPSPLFQGLVPELPEDLSRSLKATPYLSALCLVLVLSRPFTPYYWLNIGDRDIPFVAAIEHSNLVPAADYGGRRVLYLSNYLLAGHQLYGLAPAELLAHYLPHLQRINPQFDTSWIEEYHLFRDETAQPVVTAGYSSRILPVRAPIGGLYLVNNAQIYPEDRGMNYSVRLGRQVAQMVLSDQKGEPV